MSLLFHCYIGIVGSRNLKPSHHHRVSIICERLRTQATRHPPLHSKKHVLSRQSRSVAVAVVCRLRRRLILERFKLKLSKAESDRVPSGGGDPHERAVFATIDFRNRGDLSPLPRRALLMPSVIFLSMKPDAARLRRYIE